ncbi:hypothetical protein DSO57_1028658 [Entomophthora muscae]|uniref:Uncharacterized protein n=1 Tax=Entomophthora muscae TaxID=34485 RepID=A0ACC2RG66_9FUNG|nr:hypothetical protein DSO57_1028658 [Entomophthora muscae]
MLMDLVIQADFLVWLRVTGNQIAGYKPAWLEPCWRVKPAVSTPGGIPKGYVIYQDQLVLSSVYNWLRLGQRDASVAPPQLDLSQCMLNLQLESFTGGVKGDDVVSWLQSTKTLLHICQVPESMWVATASGRLTRPAAVWFTNWASQEFDVTWATF